MNTSLHSSNLHSNITEKEDAILPEIQRHKERWNSTLELWENEVLLIKYFADDRPDYVEEEIISYFGLSGINDLFLDTYPPETGRVQVSTLNIGDFPWTGEYFSDVPLTFTGLDVPGYRFAGWSGDVTSDDPEITIIPDGTISLMAWFEPDEATQNTIVINEINYNSSNAEDSGDWVEIYNNSNSTYDLIGWELKDAEETNSFVIENSLLLPPDSYHVFCRNSDSFLSVYPNVNIAGDFDFGFSGSGDAVQLLDSSGELIDIVEYDDTPPWPISADGGGHTLSLIDPNLDNSLPENWAASLSVGTPGVQNDVSDIEPEPEYINFVLFPAYPNPLYSNGNSRSLLRIDYYIHTPGKATIEIFNIKGQKVKTLFDEPKEKGADTVFWNTTDKNNQAVATGIYFYKLKSGNFEQIKKMVLIK